MQASSAQQRALVGNSNNPFLPRIGPRIFPSKFPLRHGGLLPPRSCLANESKQAEKTRKFFEALRDIDRGRLLHLKKMQEKEDRQYELEAVQAKEWAKFLSKLQGKAKGTYWDPEPGPNILFSDFTKLLQAKKVQFMEYANAGEDVAVSWCFKALLDPVCVLAVMPRRWSAFSGPPTSHPVEDNGSTLLYTQLQCICSLFEPQHSPVDGSLQGHTLESSSSISLRSQQC